MEELQNAHAICPRRTIYPGGLVAQEDFLTKGTFGSILASAHDRGLSPDHIAAAEWRRRGAIRQRWSIVPENVPEIGKYAAKKTQRASRIARQPSKFWNCDDFRR
jgi:hypothetical protein